MLIGSGDNGQNQLDSLPSLNFVELSLLDVGFIDPATGDFRLSDLSPYRLAGTDGKDIGVDFAALIAAMLAGAAAWSPCRAWTRVRIAGIRGTSDECGRGQRP